MDNKFPSDRSHDRNRIRDTAGQDQVRIAPANPNRRRWLVGGIAGVALVAVIGWVAGVGVKISGTGEVKSQEGPVDESQ